MHANKKLNCVFLKLLFFNLKKLKHLSLRTAGIQITELPGIQIMRKYNIQIASQ